MHSAVGRGDDARLVKICHMCVPTHLTCIGPLPYYFMAVVLLGGKTMKVRSWGSRIWVALAKQLPRPGGDTSDPRTQRGRDARRRASANGVSTRTMAP